MRIAVCIKQVPLVSALQFDANTRTLKREGVPQEISAFDVRALLKAVELKAAHGGEIVALSMGPPQARAALLDCLALGADRAVHLCDRAFAGADTLATARALALALRREPFDLVLCGRNSIDAETGQVGPEIAELLDLPQLTGARTLTVDLDARTVTAERQTDDGFETLTAPLPALVTAAEDLAPERFPSTAERAAAQAKTCVELRATDLSPDASQFGFAGSPTEVAGLQPIATTRLKRIIEDTVEEAAAKLSRILVEEHGLFGTWKVHEQPALATELTRPPVAPARAAVVQGHGGNEVWVVAEVRGGTIRPVVFELLGKAGELASATAAQVSAVLLGHGVRPLAGTLAAYGADRVLLGDDPSLAPFRAEVHTTALVEALRTRAPGILLFPATSMGRDLAPRLAARLQLGLTGDCLDVGLDAGGRLLQYKPAFGGSFVAPIVSRTLPQMATVRPGMLRAPIPDPSRQAQIEGLVLGAIQPRSRVVERRAEGETAAELDRAEVIVGIGKGIGGPAQIGTIQPLVQLLRAALCTTRDVTDAGWLPKQYQVGLTGRAIAPKLYLAIAIRGAFEHIVGVRRAGLVVAINKNAKAPIFKAADYGIVGDYVEVVPALCRHLSNVRASSSPSP